MDLVKCDSCGYEGSISLYEPTVSVYTDIRCPKCQSTNNQHNRDYLDSLQKKMRESEE